MAMISIGTISEYRDSYPITVFMPQVGSYVKPDCWAIGECLIAGDDFSAYRLPTHNPIVKSLAVNVEVTGRKVMSNYGERFVRVRITFLGDGEPDQHTSGWMKVEL